MGRGEVRKQVEYPAKDMEHCFLHFDDMRAADCEILAEKPAGLLRQARNMESGKLSIFADCQKSLAEFAADAANKFQIVFGRGVYVDKNTSQTASVEFSCQWKTNYARSRLQKPG